MQFGKTWLSFFLIGGALLGLSLLREASAFSSRPAALVMDNNPTNLTGFTCSDGWRITGYFTPIEDDYAAGDSTEIDVKGLGKVRFDSDFVRVVFDESKGFGEGWGKTRFGWYLGNYQDTWHKSDAPLDANDAVLKPNSVAVDNILIPNDSLVRVPNLPGSYGAKSYLANDVGVTVHGKHIDIYTGEGKEAERAMYRITFEDEGQLQRVCFQTPETGR